MVLISDDQTIATGRQFFQKVIDGMFANRFQIWIILVQDILIIEPEVMFVTYLDGSTSERVGKWRHLLVILKRKILFIINLK